MTQVLPVRVSLFGRDAQKAQELVRRAGFLIAQDNFDFIVSYGGDGTLMQAEHVYPGVPKILLRNSIICKLCSSLPNELLLEQIKEQNYSIEEFWKLEGCAKGQSVFAVNDIVVHNADPRHAIRYELYINEKKIGATIIGDGIVCSTPFGSTGYYRSITDSFFELGIGLAFNNSTEQSDHMVLREESTISLRIVRGPACLYADNQETTIKLDEGDEIIVKKSATNMRLVRVELPLHKKN